ncbi:sugar phosphate isomerase/epimerase family protein [Paenibacillus sp. CMAA1364]
MLQVGLQLYTIRDQMETDFEGTLKKVAELGYKGVEFHAFFGRSSSEVKRLLDENGLEVIGTHLPYEDLLGDIQSIITYNQEIGNKNLIIPHLTEEQRKWDEVFDNLTRIGEKCKEQGMVLLYHNHDFEFKESYGNQTAFDAMYEAVPASLLQVEMDTCWVHFAGYDAVEYIHKYKGRLPLVHWKDVVRQEDGTALTVEFGHGEVDLVAIAEAANQVGVEWLIVEQDVCVNPSMESIATSMNWIRNYKNNGGPIHV